MKQAIGVQQAVNASLTSADAELPDLSWTPSFVGLLHNELYYLSAHAHAADNMPHYGQFSMA